MKLWVSSILKRLQAARSKDDDESRNKAHPESDCQEFDAAAGSFKSINLVIRPNLWYTKISKIWANL
jgi:hypothetical protein